MTDGLQSAGPNLRDLVTLYVSKIEQSIVDQRSLTEAEFRSMGAELKRVWDRFTSLQIAVDKAEKASDIRMANANEFRDALKDQAARMATNSELAALEKALDSKMDNITGSRTLAHETLERNLSARISTLEAANIAAETRRTETQRVMGSRFIILFVVLAVMQFLLAATSFIVTKFVFAPK